MITSGTGKRAATSDSPEWGKTGTTENNGDAWFCGATKEITACVWVGHADSTQSMNTEFGGQPVDGGTFPALIWNQVINAYDNIQAGRAASSGSSSSSSSSGGYVPSTGSSGTSSSGGGGGGRREADPRSRGRRRRAVAVARAASAPASSDPSLGPEFFDRSVHEVARGLVGCTLLVDGVGGVIVETEAYDATDPACHAYNGRTPRNEPLFGPPGRAYVYLSYGIHQLLNAVAEPQGSPAAALIRAIEPLAGIEEMRERRGVESPGQLCSGPGKLTEALGVTSAHNGAALDEAPFTILERDSEWGSNEVVTDTRIGISRAVERPWRYCAAGSRFLSKPVSSSG